MQNLFQTYPVAVLTLFVLCGGVPSYAQHEGCVDATGDCYEAHSGRGCNCQSCCEIVCEVDSACCDKQWDFICANYANYVCSEDCNDNGVPDPFEICSGASVDCNRNNIPDECENDCNCNGVPDAQDISDGTSTDCNSNEVPDDCDLADGTSEDCNANGVPDECDVSDGTSEDCDANGVPDECDFSGGNSEDCNGNGQIDQDEGPTFCLDGSVVPVDLIVIADPSGSDSDKMPDLCSLVFRTAVTRLSKEFDVRAIWTSVSQDVPNSGCHDFTIPNGTEVPVCGSITPRVIDDNDGEEWGDATAIMTTPFEEHLLGQLEWDERDAVLILIPISDEGPQNGNDDGACYCDDEASVGNLISQAWTQNVQVLPIPTLETPSCVYDPVDTASLMAIVAEETGGSVVDARSWPSGISSAELSLQLEDAIRAAVALSPRIDCSCTGDPNDDGMVDGSDLTVVLAAWGTADPNGDLNEDGVVDGADVTVVLAAWGACP